ncbi:MAG: type II toxin-antitoxin system HipA family toxin [Planctomycetota bacterium]
MLTGVEPPDLRAIEALDVLVDDGKGVDQHVGRSTRTALGCELRYHIAGLDPKVAVSHRLPVRAEPYVVNGVNLLPYFAGLLPEGLRMRAIAGIQPKVSAFRLTLPVRTTGRRTTGGRTTGGRTSRRSSECILKLEPDELPCLVANERFFMTLAREAGLDVARVSEVTDPSGCSALLVERFDRSIDPLTGRVVKYAQEDACQLLGHYPADKYRVALHEFAQALEVCDAPLQARLDLLRVVAFSYLIANGDMHGKNISVHTADGITRLAPVYNLLSTLPYGDDRMALKIEGRDKRLQRKDFVAFGERVGVRGVATERMLSTLVKRVGRRLGDAAKPALASIGLDERATRHLERTIEERLSALS